MADQSFIPSPPIASYTTYTCAICKLHGNIYECDDMHVHNHHIRTKHLSGPRRLEFSAADARSIVSSHLLASTDVDDGSRLGSGRRRTDAERATQRRQPARPTGLRSSHSQVAPQCCYV
eukprot:4704939-Pyramimonas_sp.AAC.1